MDFRITIPNQSGELIGLLNKNSPETLYISCHGYGGSKDDSVVTGLSVALARHGFSTFRFDFSGTGESTGGSGILVERQAGDLLQVLDYFRTFPKIILIGASLGALPTVLTSLKSAKVTAIVTVNGFFAKPPRDRKYWRAFMGVRILTLIVPRFRRAYRQFTLSFRPEKIKVPTLVICTKKDKAVDYRQSVDFYNLLTVRNKRLAILPLASHDISGAGDVDRVVDEIISWGNNREKRKNR
jgi:pimeloyl-ACP methyl ester carboxylesterase